MKAIYLTAALALATASCAFEPQMQTTPDPALGASATARHHEMAARPVALDPAMGKSAKDRHTAGNY